MKRIIVSVLVLSLVMISMPALAAQGGTKGASQKAVENASDEAVFNRVGDWFATVGKSPEEKEKILAERKAQRVKKRAEKEAEKLKREAEKETKKMGKQADKKTKKAEKQIGYKYNKK